MFSANDQSVPVLAFSHDGSLLAEGRCSWVALWDMRDPSSPRRLAAWHSTTGDPTALAVLDDGRALAASATTSWRLGRARRRLVHTVVPGDTDTEVQHLNADAEGTKVLVDYPSFEDVPVVDPETGATTGTYPATDPGAPPSSLPPVSWTTTLAPTAGRSPPSTWPAAGTRSTPRTATCSPG